MLKDFPNDKGKLGKIKEQQFEEFPIYALAPISITETSREARIDIESYLNCILNLTDDNWADTSCEEFKDLDFRYLQLGRGRENSLKLLAIRCDFSEARINLTAFKDLNIANCNITKTKFRGQSETKMNFVQCYGFGADFFHLNIKGKNFQSSNFSFAIFQFSTFSKVRFNSCKLQGATLGGLYLQMLRSIALTFHAQLYGTPHSKMLNSNIPIFYAQIFQGQIWLACQVSRKRSSIKSSIIKMTRPLIALKVWNSQKMALMKHPMVKEFLLHQRIHSSVGDMCMKCTTNC